jgi:hypothetical protein
MKAQLILLLVEKACWIWLMYNLVLVCFLKVLVIASRYRSIWNKRDALIVQASRYRRRLHHESAIDFTISGKGLSDLAYV